ncbi:aquaporin-10-like [Anguilla anguilla]|uniref:aquaporin-10-like n=1 Tax=Anguilla anguilla TaxID=7936 RepID=UPI0015AFF50A|nr:aquaporin-10-like [Anguilla anguilla]
MDSVFRRVRIESLLLRQCLAECLGVYVLIVFGCGAVAQVTTSENTKGQYLSINLGFALGTTFGVYVSRGVSGAHLNPAVTLSLCMLGRHPWRTLPFYVFFQVFGAFLAAATVALQYYDAIMHFSNGQLTVTGPTATAGIFATYPADYLSLWSGFVDQVIGTGMLLVCILAVGDRRNTRIPPELAPLLVGLVVLVIGISMGVNCGYALNPARDLGPRLYSYIAGWGEQVFWAGGGWWWVPLVAPCVGALVGSVVYVLLIEAHHPELDLHLEKADQCQTVDNKLALELEGVELDLNSPKGCPNEGQEGKKAASGKGEEG